MSELHLRTILDTRVAQCLSLFRVPAPALTSCSTTERNFSGSKERTHCSNQSDQNDLINLSVQTQRDKVKGMSRFLALQSDTETDFYETAHFLKCCVENV